MIQIPVEPKITDYLHRKAARNHIPLSGTFELTPVCNMDCKMCYVRMSKKQQESIAPLKSAKEWIELGKRAKEAGLLYLLLTGGEPFLRPDFKEIMQGLHELGLIISINSNATLINEQTIEWLKQTPPVRINITLYGASDATYERLCMNPKGFTQATHAISLLQEAGISIKINCSLTPENANDVEAIFQYCKDHHLIIQATSYMFPPVRKDEKLIGKNHRFTPEQAAYCSAKMESLYNGDQDFLQRLEKKQFGTLGGDLEDDCIDVEGEGIKCRAGKCCFWVTWKGDFMPCGMLPPIPDNNVFELGIETVWKNAVDFASSIRLPAKCTNCNLKHQCKACAAMVYAESGDFSKVPEYRCLMAQKYEEACYKVKEEILKKREINNEK